MGASVVAVALSPVHTFSKPLALAISLVEGLGVEGDAHAGATVKHRSRVARDPSQPNLRKVHLLHREMLDEVNADPRFDIGPGDIGENVTTTGADLLALPRGTWLRLGPDAVVAVTGLRNPCSQLDHFRDGLTHAFLGRDGEGNLVRKAGVMAVVVADGEVKAGDAIAVELPKTPHLPLEPV